MTEKDINTSSGCAARKQVKQVKELKFVFTLLDALFVFHYAVCCERLVAFITIFD